MSLLEETLARIEPLDAEAARAATARLDSLTKPHGSLGYLEEIVRRYAAIRHDATAAPGRGAIAIFVADHGVAAARIRCRAFVIAVSARAPRIFFMGPRCQRRRRTRRSA